jgi:hypothetical protein
MVQNPLKIQEKNFIWVFIPVLNPLVLGPKNFSNFFWLQLVPGTSIKKINKKNPGSTWY